MPITDRSQAKEGGFGQVREALQKFKGTVTGAVFDMWGGQLIDEEGKKRPPKEFLEISFTDVEVLESTEELTMDISELWTVRINCSDFKGSFWMDMFLASSDKFKIPIPDGLKGKRITMEKQTLENDDPKYNKTDWVIIAVEDAPAKPNALAASAQPPAQGGALDAQALIAELAVGKTEAELKAAIEVDPTLAGNPVHPLAKAGVITLGLVNEGKLALVDGKYQKPA